MTNDEKAQRALAALDPIRIANRLQQRHAGHLSQPHDMGIPPQGRIRPHRPDAQKPERRLSRPA